MQLLAPKFAEHVAEEGIGLSPGGPEPVVEHRFRSSHRLLPIERSLEHTPSSPLKSSAPSLPATRPSRLLRWRDFLLRLPNGNLQLAGFFGLEATPACRVRISSRERAFIQRPLRPKLC